MKKIIAALLMVPCMAHAEFFTGNMLLTRMQSKDYMDQMQALGYVMGVFDASNLIDHCGGNRHTITGGQAMDVARQYIENNPSVRDSAADLLVRVAFKKAWPCPKSNNKGA
jgi:hypothetical protein